MRAQDEYKQWQVTLQAQAPTFAEMLPADVPIQRFIKIALNAIWQDPELLKCSKRSLIRAFLMASRAGLLPDGREGVILAFRERRRDGEEFNAQFIPMVAGLIQLAYRAGVKTIITDVVRENDEWELERGDYPRIVHRPKIDPAEGGRMIWAYAIAVMPDDTRHHAWVSGAYIEKVRQSSRAPDGRLWTVWQEQAWKKTAIRQLFKSLPLARGEPAERLQAATEAEDEMSAAVEPVEYEVPTEERAALGAQRNDPIDEVVGKFRERKAKKEAKEEMQRIAFEGMAGDDTGDSGDLEG